MSILQEAQQDTIMSFERYMSDCMTRDWATDKQGLFSSVAPYTGLGGAAAGGLSFGSVARADVGEHFCQHEVMRPTRQCYLSIVLLSRLYTCSTDHLLGVWFSCTACCSCFIYRRRYFRTQRAGLRCSRQAAQHSCSTEATCRPYLCFWGSL